MVGRNERERWLTVRRVFEELIEVDSAERERRLAELEPGLAAEVAGLLARDAESEGIEPPPGILGAFGEDSLPPGSLLGSYRLLEPLGSGGMGTVYRAERADDEFRKSVAIKLVKRGMDSAEVIRRFRKERQVLADLEHPGIARLLDGGVAPDGRPYLVMEFVEGELVDDWCQRLLPTLGARLRLFGAVCEAVQHAHDRGVVHRDLKPGNVLVNTEGVPKLLDFGVAKVLEGQGADETQLTAPNAFLGTPGYASPEQLRGDEIDPATDVYSLGVLLYQLLSGTRPHELSRFSRAEGIRRVLEVDPPPPSQRLGEEPGEFGLKEVEVRGDLDNITLKALRKEPERRYGSPRELAQDLERFLAGKPVEARPSTLGYRVRKLVRRHRTATAFGLAGGAALVFAALAQHEAQARDESGARAVSEAREEAGQSEARAAARLEGLREQVRAVVQEMGGGLDATDATVAVRERLMASALARLDGVAAEGEDDPGLLEDLAIGYVDLGHLQAGFIKDGTGNVELARESFRKAVGFAQELRERDPEGESWRRQMSRATAGLGSLERLAGRRSEALELYQEARQLLSEGDLELGLSELKLLGREADLLLSIGDGEGALALLEQSRALTSGGVDEASRREHVRLTGVLAEFLLREGRAEEALQHLEEGVEVLSELIDSPGVRGELAARLGDISELLLRLGRMEESEAVIREAIEVFEPLAGADSDDGPLNRSHAKLLHFLGRAQLIAGEEQAALESLAHSSELLEGILERSPDDEVTRRMLGRVLVMRGVATSRGGDLPAGLELLESARRQFRAVIEEAPEEAMRHRDLAGCLNALVDTHALAARIAADASVSRGHAEEARRHAEEAERAYEQVEAILGSLLPVDEQQLERIRAAAAATSQEVD